MTHKVILLINHVDLSVYMTNWICLIYNSTRPIVTNCAKMMSYCQGLPPIKSHKVTWGHIKNQQKYISTIKISLARKLRWLVITLRSSKLKTFYLYYCNTCSPKFGSVWLLMTILKLVTLIFEILTSLKELN